MGVYIEVKMRKVSVEFFDTDRWAVDLETQIEVKEGEIVDDLPIDFAYRVKDSGRGKILDEVEDEETVKTVLFVLPELEQLTVAQLKELAKKLDCPKANKKEDLIANILNEQEYNKKFLNHIEDENVFAIAEAKGLDWHGYQVNDVVELILESQNEGSKA